MSEVLDNPAAAAPAAAPAPAAAAPAAPAPTPAAPSVAWLPNADADTVGFIQNKAWQSPADAVAGYRGIEKLLGADRAGRTVVLPADKADAAAMGEVFDKLGRPSSPDGYGIKAPDGADPNFAKAAATAFHAAGLSESQGKALGQWYQDQVAAAQAAQAAQEEAALRAEHQQLEQDWGTGPAATVQKEIARRAAAKLGLDEAAVAALEKVIGFSKTMKAFAKMGELMGEAKFEAGSGGTFGMTPEAAKARKSQLIADKDWRTRAMNPKSAEWAEMAKLDEIIASSLPQY